MKLRPMKVTVVVADGRRLGHRVWRSLPDWRRDTEGSEWVRGHVREGSPAGDALLAAYALQGSREDTLWFGPAAARTYTGARVTVTVNGHHL